MYISWLDKERKLPNITSKPTYIACILYHLPFSEMMCLYLSSLSPWNSTYSTEDGHLVFKVYSSSLSTPRRTLFYRALPDVTLPTSERQLWEERHFFETHASSQHHPELDGQGSGLFQDGVIMEETREHFSPALESDTSLYEYPLKDASYKSKRSHSPSPSRSSHSDSHPFWTKEHWVHFADAIYHGPHKTQFNLAGKEFTADEFFDSSSNHIWHFTAWDGHRYRWYTKDKHPKLFRCGTDNQDGELIAEFEHSHVTSDHGSTKRKIVPPCLTVYDLGESLTDLILVTLVFLELSERTDAGMQDDVRFSGPRGTPVFTTASSLGGETTAMRTVALMQ